MARYYFAYGSNLSHEQIQTRCPDSKAVAAVVAKGWQLGFFGESTKRWGIGGVASLVAGSNATVGGALYRLSESDEFAMDGFEGTAQGKYYKDEGFAKHVVWSELTSTDVVYAYIMANHDTQYLPSDKYLNVIQLGYRDWNLPGCDSLEKFRRKG